MKRSIILAVLALTAAMSASAAVQSSATVNVSATVIGSCKWNTPLTFDFGSYDPFSTSDLTKTGVTISFSCVKSTAAGDVYKVSFTKSGGTLANGTNTLPYSLYVGGTTNALPATGAGTTVAGTSGIGGSYTYTIDGMIPKNQDVPVGTYTDTLTAQIEY